MRFDDLRDLPIFLINLDHRTDRLHQATQTINDIGWRGPTIRVPGVVIERKSPEFLSGKIRLQTGPNKSFHKPTLPDKIFHGTLACTKAHLSIADRAAESGIIQYVVFEDDVIMSPEFSKLPDILIDAPDILVLGEQYHNRYKPLESGWEIINPAKAPVWGTHAYIVLTNAGRSYLQTFWRAVHTAADAVWNVPEPTITMLLHRPALLYQRNSPSDISP